MKIEDACPYLKEDKLMGLDEFVYCSVDRIALYRKCCPPKNLRNIFKCFEEYALCEEFQKKFNLEKMSSNIFV